MGKGRGKGRGILLFMSKRIKVGTWKRSRLNLFLLKISKYILVSKQYKCTWQTYQIYSTQKTTPNPRYIRYNIPPSPKPKRLEIKVQLNKTKQEGKEDGWWSYFPSTSSIPTQAVKGKPNNAKSDGSHGIKSKLTPTHAIASQSHMLLLEPPTPFYSPNNQPHLTIYFQSLVHSLSLKISQ